MRQNLLEALHAAALQPADWEAALERLANEFGSGIAMMGKRDHATGRAAIVTARQDPEQVRAYVTRFAGRDPLWARAPALREDGAYTDADLVPRDVFLASEVYNEWGRPQGIHGSLALLVEKDGKRTSIVTILQSHGRERFDAADKEKLAFLLPHLKLVFRVQRSLQDSGIAAWAGLSSLNRVGGAAALLDINRVLGANARASALFEEADGLVVRQGRLHAVLPGPDEALQRALSAASREPPDARAGLVAIARPSRKPRLLVTVASAPSLRPNFLLASARVLVIILDPAAVPVSEADRLATAFGLSPAEIKFATCFMRTANVREAAELAGITVGTARVHLHHLLRKTDAINQAGLMRALLSVS